MKTNMGTADKTTRVGAALLIGVLYFAGTISGTVAMILLALAGIFILTSIVGFCPLYWPFGISTKRRTISK
jgi:hypothetical protein